MTLWGGGVVLDMFCDRQATLFGTLLYDTFCVKNCVTFGGGRGLNHNVTMTLFFQNSLEIPLTFIV